MIIKKEEHSKQREQQCEVSELGVVKAGVEWGQRAVAGGKEQC